MSRLPQPGGDDGQWGEILNDYLSQVHEPDGTLKANTVGATQLKSTSITNVSIVDGTIQQSKLHTDVQAKLDAPAAIADGSVTTAKLADGAVTTAKLDGLGDADGIASLDSAGKLPDAQTPMGYMEDSTGRRLDSFRAISADQVGAATLYPRLAPADTPAIPAVAVADDVPVITTSSTATVTGGRIIGPHSGQVTEVGSRGGWDSSLGKYTVSGRGTAPGLDFFLTGTTIEIPIITNGSGSTPIWVWVNGSPVTATPDTTSVSTSTGVPLFVKFVFPTSKQRHVELFQAYGSVLNAWQGLRIPMDHLITPAPRKPVFGFVGDSFFAGSAPSPEFQSAPFLISRMLGVECVSLSFGGTGYVAAGAFTVFGSTSRVTNIGAANPEVIIFSGSVNDDGNAATVGAAATAAYAAYGVACPDAKLIVFGPQPNNATSTIAANRSAVNAALKTAAEAASNVIGFVDMIGTATGVPAAYNAGTVYSTGDRVTYIGSVWEANNGTSGATFSGAAPGASSRWKLVTYVFDGTGRVGSTTGDGNRDTFLYSDAVHPTVAGSAALAIRQAEAIRAVLQAYAAAV